MTAPHPITAAKSTVHVPVMIKPMGKIFMVTPGRTKGFAVFGVPEKTLSRKEASVVGRAVVRFVLRSERETIGRSRDWRVVLDGVSFGSEASWTKRCTYMFIVLLRNRGFICPTNT